MVVVCRLVKWGSAAIRARHSHNGWQWLLLLYRGNRGRPRRPCTVPAFAWRQHRSGINWCGRDRSGGRKGTRNVSFRTGTRGWICRRRKSWQRLVCGGSCSHPAGRSKTWQGLDTCTDCSDPPRTWLRGRTVEWTGKVSSFARHLLWSFQSVDGRSSEDKFHPNTRVLRIHGP